MLKARELVFVEPGAPIIDIRARTDSRQYIETLFTANPAAIKAGADEISELNPFHLAAMTKNPRMENIQRHLSTWPPFIQIVLRWRKSWPSSTLPRWKCRKHEETLRFMLLPDTPQVWMYFASWFLSVLHY